MGATLHRERAAGCHPDLHRLLDAWAERLPFAVLVISGRRSEEAQHAEWIKGRRQKPDGSWEVVDPRAVTTKAQHASDSAHGRGAAIDAMPLNDSGRLEWDTPLAMARIHQMAEVADAIGVDWGGRFPGFPDYDHWQVRNWRALPV